MFTFDIYIMAVNIDCFMLIKLLYCIVLYISKQRTLIDMSSVTPARTNTLRYTMLCGVDNTVN